MIVDTMYEQLYENCGISAYNKEHNLDNIMRYELFDSYEYDYGPEDETQDDESWMDDLDEAA